MPVLFLRNFHDFEKCGKHAVRHAKCKGRDLLISEGTFANMIITIGAYCHDTSGNCQSLVSSKILYTIIRYKHNCINVYEPCKPIILPVTITRTNRNNCFIWLQYPEPACWRYSSNSPSVSPRSVWTQTNTSPTKPHTRGHYSAPTRTWLPPTASEYQIPLDIFFFFFFFLMWWAPSGPFLHSHKGIEGD